MKIRINRFQFLIGTIKTNLVWLDYDEWMPFQFLIGTIKTEYRRLFL